MEDKKYNDGFELYRSSLEIVDFLKNHPKLDNKDGERLRRAEKTSGDLKELLTGFYPEK